MNSFDQRITYNLFVRLKNGDLMLLAVLDDLPRAKQLVKSLNAQWPGEYFVRDTFTGQNIDCD